MRVASQKCTTATLEQFIPKMEKSMNLNLDPKLLSQLAYL